MRSCCGGGVCGLVHPLSNFVHLLDVRSALWVGTDATSHQLSQLCERDEGERERGEEY